MQLEIKPYVGVGPIKLGMTRCEMRKAVGRVPREFLKGPDSVIPTDSFDDLGIHVYYKAPDICEAVEMFLAADPTLDGRRLIERPFDQLLSWFETKDDSIKVDKTGLTSFKFGIALYAPDITERADAPVEAVLVFEKGYYDSDEWTDQQ